MGGNRQFLNAVGSLFMHPDMATPLAHNNPAGTLECGHYKRVIERRDFSQTTTSAISPSLPAKSSSTGSRYNSIASRMFRRASSRESPSLIQPGKLGTYAVNPPSSLD